MGLFHCAKSVTFVFGTGTRVVKETVPGPEAAKLVAEGLIEDVKAAAKSSDEQE